MASNHHQPTFSPNRSMKASAFQRTQLENSNSPASPKRLVLTQSTTISPVSSPRRTGFNESETNSPRSSRTPAQVREEDKLGNGWKGNIVTEWRENGTKRAESADSNDEFVMIEKIDCRGETSREKEQRIELEFSKLLDTMDLTKTVRSRMLALTTLQVKQGMLTSSPSTSPLFTTIPPSPSKPTLRKSKSKAGTGKNENVFPGSNEGNEPFLFFTSKAVKDKRNPLQVSMPDSPPYNLASPPVSPTKPTYSRNNSSFLRSLGRSTLPSAPDKSVPIGSDAAHQAVWLRTTKFEKLDISKLGELRRRLRNESTGWVEEFLRCGGYVGLLERLKELIEVEFREEQRDDKLLHEVLRCIKSLTLTSSGRKSLTNSSPTPWVQLASLLYSPKKPGDIPTRSLLVELLSTVLIIQPATTEFDWSDSIQPNSFRASGDVFVRKAKTGEEEGINGAHNFLERLMRGPPDIKLEREVTFMSEIRKPRIYKQWVREILDVKRDYFWIFCHPDNTFWKGDRVDAEAIEAPQVPSGMTNGVESEAITYLLEHLKLLNGLAATCETEASAFAFHLNLFKSGFGEALLDIRKASRLYYPVLHLELSRYVANARAARFNLQFEILQFVEPSSLSRAETEIVAIGRERERAKRDGRRLLEVEF